MAESTPLTDDYGPGCDCTVLCGMGPTCPGGILAGIDGSGCHRLTDDPTHDGNHSPLPAGARLRAGFCATCDAALAPTPQPQPTEVAGELWLLDGPGA